MIGRRAAAGTLAVLALALGSGAARAGDKGFKTDGDTVPLVLTANTEADTVAVGRGYYGGYRGYAGHYGGYRGFYGRPAYAHYGGYRPYYGHYHYRPYYGFARYGYYPRYYGGYFPYRSYYYPRFYASYYPFLYSSLASYLFGYGYASPYYGYSSPYYYSTPYSYSTPIYYSGYSPSGVTVAPSVTPLPSSSTVIETVPAPRPVAPPPMPPPATPEGTYRYDGGPVVPVPMPGVDTPPARAPGSPPASDLRQVSLPKAEKPSYPAYGESARRAANEVRGPQVDYTGVRKAAK